MAKRARPIRRRTENEASQLAHDKEGETAFKALHELAFRYELEILLSEYQAKRATKAIDYKDGTKANYWGEFVAQDVDYIAREIQSRLAANHDKHPSIYQIKTYLKVVNRVIASKLANNEDISAIPFVGLVNHLPKKRGKKRAIKRGKKRSYNYKGETYESIRQAALAHPNETSYNTLRMQAWREMKRENSI